MSKNITDIMADRARVIAQSLIKQGFKVDPNQLARSVRAYSVSGEIEGNASGSEFDAIITDDNAAALDGTVGDHIALEPTKGGVAWLPIGIANAAADAVQSTWGLGGFRVSDTEIPRAEHMSTSSFGLRRLSAHFWSTAAVEKGLDYFPYLDMRPGTKDQPWRGGLYNYAAAAATQVFSALLFYIEVPEAYVPPGHTCPCPLDPNGRCQS